MRVLLALASLLMISFSAKAVTYVYVSNAEDGDIGMYTLQTDGSLKAGERFKADKVVMPMSVSPDRKYLVAAVRSKPYSALTYGIDRKSGELKLIGGGPLAESFPYIRHDTTGRWLLGASYGGNLGSVNPIGKEGGASTRSARKALPASRSR